jgi:2-oxoglutarate dehydrogenase E2 component (dihydrolipoamide succinyltransferase)
LETFKPTRKENDTMAIEIRVPTLGESVTEATIGQWFKQKGDVVKVDEPLVELETDKVTIEVPAPTDGVLVEIIAAEGETVGVDALLASLDAQGAAAPAPVEKADAPVKTAADESALVDVVVPSGGESVTEADVGEWYKKVGDVIAVDDALLELETDKAAQEVMAQSAGRLEEILTPTGTTVEVGAVLARIRVGSPASAASPAQKEETKAPAPTTMPASPSASRMMSENSIAAGDVAGSGKRGQVLKQDVRAAMDKIADAPAPEPLAIPILAAAPAVDAVPSAGSDEPREERVRMTRLRQTIARRLKHKIPLPC